MPGTAHAPDPRAQLTHARAVYHKSEALRLHHQFVAGRQRTLRIGQLEATGGEMARPLRME